MSHWEFEYGPAPNDPKFGLGVQGKESIDENSDDKEQESAGRWIHRLTGEKLGGEQGYLEFTVVGLTVANEMLSLQGSIQSDPFSPKHAARMHAMQHAGAETDIDELEAELEDSDDSSDLDTFRLLNHQAARAVTVGKQKRKLEGDSEGPKKKPKGNYKQRDQAKSKKKKVKV